MTGIMIKMNVAILGLAIALGIAGCTPEAEHWVGGESPKRLHVDHLRMKFIATFAPDSADLSKTEIAKLDAFLDQSGVRHSDHVYIEASPDDPMAATRIGQLAQELDRRGLGAQAVPADADGPTANQLIVLVDRYVVSLPDCPNWTLPPANDHGNEVASNFGCATTTDLGLMIDDPRDLVIGRTMGPADANPAIDAVARYRDDKSKPLAGSGGGTGTGGVTAGAGAGATGGAGGGGATPTVSQ